MISLSSRTCALLWLGVACAAWAGASLAVSAGPLPNNHELLTSLGLVRRRVGQGGHHRKRLAGAAEMRSSAAAGGPAKHDSHMVVIKLPPSQYYYANAKPNVKADPKSANAINKVPLSFQGNGKPSGVYHWNIPVIKKMKSSGRGRHGGASKRAPDGNGDSKIYHIQKNPPFTEHTSSRNDVLKGKDAAEANSKAQGAKNPKISYYSPRRKTMFRKYFQGNGKPNSFYVMEKSKKPIHYHRLLP